MIGQGAVNDFEIEEFNLYGSSSSQLAAYPLAFDTPQLAAGSFMDYERVR